MRAAADAAVKALGWTKAVPRRCRPHPARNRRSLPPALATSSPSTWPTPSASPPTPRPRSQAFVDRHRELIGTIDDPADRRPFHTTRAECERIAGKYLLAVQDAGAIYRHIAAAKGAGNFITEVSMDETDSPADAAGAAA